MSSFDDDDTGLGGFKRPATPEYEPVEKARVTATDFNPFAALGLDPSTVTAAAVRPAFLRSLRHRTPLALVNHPTTAAAFPSQLQIMQANEYLSSSATAITTARNRWARRHVANFHPTLPVGDAGVFVTTTAAATPSSTPRSSATATPSSSGSSFRPSSSRPSATRHHPYGNFRQPFHGRTATGSGRAGDPVDLTTTDDEEDDDNDDNNDDDDDAPPSPSATAAANKAARASAAAATTTTTTIYTATATGVIVANTTTTTTAPPPPPRPPRVRTANRSGGSSARYSALDNPPVGERVNVGTWRTPTGTAAPNVVVAGFDVRGRIFYRVTNLDVSGNVIAAPTATAVRFEDIDFRAAYVGHTASDLRHLVAQHLRLPPAQRP